MHSPETTTPFLPHGGYRRLICAVNQTAYLLKRQLQSQGEIFVEQGGFTEKLYSTRKQAKSSERSDRSDSSDKSEKR